MFNTFNGVLCHKQDKLIRDEEHPLRIPSGVFEDEVKNWSSVVEGLSITYDQKQGTVRLENFDSLTSY